MISDVVSFSRRITGLIWVEEDQLLVQSRNCTRFYFGMNK